MNFFGRWMQRGQRLLRLAGKVRRIPSWLRRVKALLCQVEKLPEDMQTLLSLQTSILEASIYLIEASQSQAGPQVARHEEVLSQFGIFVEKLKEKHDRSENAEAGRCVSLTAALSERRN